MAVIQITNDMTEQEHRATENNNVSYLNSTVGSANLAVALKADKTYVDTLAASLISGSPKATYATLTALQTAYPTGNTNIYLVIADGKWYYWNGSAWTAGGTYQSTGIADGSVTPEKTNSEIPNTKKHL